MNKAVLFDLDNTLFDVEQYMVGAFESVSAHLSETYDIDRKQVHQDLVALWRAETSMYPHLFDDVLEDHDIDAEVETVVEIFNDYDPSLEPYDGVTSMLDLFQQDGYAVGLITDGTARRQRRKLEALELGEYFDVVVLTAELAEPKPSAVPFQEATRRLDMDPNRCVYVGDNPQIDFSGAKKTGIWTVRLRRGEFTHLDSGPAVDDITDSIGEIYPLVEKLLAPSVS